MHSMSACGRGCVKTILGSRPGQKTRTTVALLGTHYVQTANENTLMHVLFLSDEFSHSLGHNRTKGLLVCIQKPNSQLPMKSTLVASTQKSRLADETPF